MMKYLIHLRPRSWGIVMFHFCVGGIVAAGRDTMNISAIARLLGGAIVWSVCLNGGTLALNSAFDKDEGGIGYLDSPPPVPKYLFYFSLCLILLGCPLTILFRTPGFTAAYCVCIVLSVLYSVPPVRLKAVAGFDVLINASGYGGLTFLGGWLLMANGISGKSVLLCLGFALLFASFYPLTQIYQFDHDRQRKDKTLTVHLGPRNALYFAIIFNILSFIVFLSAALVYQIEFLSLCLLLVCLFLWMVVILPWLNAMDRYDAQKGMYRALKVWGLTDFCIIIAFSDLIWKSFA